MRAELGLVVGLLGFGSGVASGLLGISGAVLMVPLLLYGPPLLDMGDLDVKTVAATAIVQGLFASSSGVIVHLRNGYVNRRITLVGGTLLTTGALAGALLSKWAPDMFLLTIFAILTTLAAVIMLSPPNPIRRDEEARFQLFRPWRLGILFPEGFAAGMVGVGGGFITVPLLNRIMGIPIRVAIGSSLAMTWFAMMAGFVGKAVTGQVHVLLSVAAVLGAIPGAQLGARLNHNIPSSYLRYLLSALMVTIATRMWLEILNQVGTI